MRRAIRKRSEEKAIGEAWNRCGIAMKNTEGNVVLKAQDEMSGFQGIPLLQPFVPFLQSNVHCHFLLNGAVGCVSLVPEIMCFDRIDPSRQSRSSLCKLRSGPDIGSTVRSDRSSSVSEVGKEMYCTFGRLRGCVRGRKNSKAILVQASRKLRLLSLPATPLR